MDTTWKKTVLVAPAALVLSLGVIGCEKKSETPATPTAKAPSTADTDAAKKTADDAAAATKEATDDAAAKTKEAVDAAEDGG